MSGRVGDGRSAVRCNLIRLSAAQRQSTPSAGAVLYAEGATWEYDGHSWMLRSPPTGPGRRVTAMAHDVLRRRTLMFGGYNPQTVLDDTWEWDGASWTLVVPTLRPTARYGHAMAFDQTGRRTLLFGGVWGRILSDETWGWDGTTWQQFTPATRPPARHGHAMALDPARSRVVLFGGYVAVGTASASDDTWEWDGTTWSQATTTVRPLARSEATMA